MKIVLMSLIVGLGFLAQAETKVETKGNKRNIASDSSWNLCQLSTPSDFTPVISVYEYRNGVHSNGETRRTTDVVYIFGGHVMTGSMESPDTGVAGTLKLKSAKGKDSFVGKFTMDYQNRTAVLKGKVTMAPSSTTTENLQFNCQTLN